MDIMDQVNINDCPNCDGASLMEEEKGVGYYVMCLDCGAHTVTIPYKSEPDHLTAAKKAAELWNFGKVIKPGPGE